jgi:predicted DNA-binding transcriptional regulator AlpA
MEVFAPVDLINNQCNYWYFTRKQIVEITGMSRGTIDRLENRGRFPKRVVLADRKVGWNVAEVEMWREERNRARFDLGAAKASE